MIKLLRYFIFILISQLLTTVCYAQFPYIESFRAATAPGITFGGAPSAFLTAAGSSAAGGTPIDPVGNGYLRLTSNVKNQKGYVYSDSDFPSKNGLRVEFEYYIYGGSGADGISFFLFDATASPFVIGGFGGSLGFAQITTTTPISPGVSKGYLAIGLDEFGNFSNPNEGRQGGIGFRPGSITLRGKGDGAALTPDNYKFLTTALTTDFGISLVGNGANRIPDSTNTGYRRVLMELAPNPVVGYDITVKLTKGGPSLTPVTVINKYHYNEPAPKNLRYGFASSTGDKTNFHEVRNVSISVFDESSLVAPTANNDIFTICEGNQATVDVSANDVTGNADAVINKASIDLDPLTIGTQKTFSIPGKGVFTANPDGTITFVPSGSFSGNVAVNYTIKDSYGKPSTAATFTVNYTEPLTTVSAGPDQVLLFSNLQLTATLNASLPGAGNSGKWTQVSGPSATITNNTLYNTTVSNLTGGISVFRWTVTSAGGCEASSDVQINVNRRPVTINDNFSTNINTDITIPVLDNDTDPDGNITIDKGSLVIKSQVQSGTVIPDLVSGSFIYRPNNGFTGSDSFTYSIKDIHGAESNIAIVTINVSLKPLGSNDNATTTTNNDITIAVIDNDQSKTGATVISSTDPANGSVVINSDGTIMYSPNSGFSGRDSFTYKLRNSAGVESDPVTVTVSVKPSGVADQSVTSTDVPVNINIKDNDLSKLSTIVVTDANPSNGTITVNANGTVLYTPTAGFSGKDSFTYHLRTTDGLDSDPITVNINVRPKGTGDDVVTPINVAANIPVKDNDLSKSGTSVIIYTNPSNGSVSINSSGLAVYTPNNGFSGQDSFTYILRTADGLDSDPINVNISIKPVGLMDEVITTTNTAVNIPARANDPSQTGTTLVLNSSPANGTAVVNSAGEVVYTPNDGYSGKDNLTYILRTQDGFESDPVAITVNVKPAGTNDNAGAIANLPVNISVKDNDISKAGTTVVINISPAKGTVAVNSSGVITFTPNPDFSGTDSFTYLLKTADGLISDPITVTLNSKPSGTADVVTTLPETPVTIPVKDNDASKTGTTVSLQSNPPNGTVVLNSSLNPVYTPNAGFSGKDVFSYKLTDVNGQESDPIPVTVNVKPVGSNDHAVTLLNTIATINIKENDLSKTGTTPSVISAPTHGSVTINSSGNALYTPTTGYSGTDVFTYKLTTADGIESDAITVNITISPSIPAPDITVGATTGQPVTIDTPIPPGGSVVITDPPKHGTVTFDPVTGDPIYTPDPGYSGPDDFTYTIKDGNGNSSAPGKVTITVTKPAKIGLAKALIANVRNQDGSYRLNYLFSIVNYGDIAMDRISLTDDLSAAFPGRTFIITKLNGSGTLKVNAAFNGTTIKEMLLNTSTLSANFKEQVELEIVIAANQPGGTFLNSATAGGYSMENGDLSSDVSTSGLTPDPVTAGDVSPATPTQTVILFAPDIEVPATSGQPVTINVPVPAGGSVVITDPPEHGTITFDPVTGQPVYTPDPGYSGPDDFTYIIKDAGGNESQPGKVTITVTNPSKIGLAKALISTVKNLDGSFNLVYRFTLVNYGSFDLDRVSLTDNLALAFPDAGYQIVNINASGTLRINTNYNGNTVTNMLLPTSTLEIKEQVEMEVRITLNKEEGKFNNFATAEGYSTNDGSVTRDQSTNGLNPDPVTAGDVSPSEFTPVNLIKGSLKIPGGFSPNNDGINDFFIVENSQGKKISLEIFNRWGNRVYKSNDYQNTWAGKSTEGIRLGEDVPSGTYYYILLIDGKDKRVGYITINR